MARKVKDAALDSPAARVVLKVRGKPYWRTIERGLHLGYRRLKGRAGTWWARHYLGEQKYEVESLGVANDAGAADGVAILDFWQAQAAARERMVRRAHSAAGRSGPLTVKAAVESYVAFLETSRKSAVDARARADAFIHPHLGQLDCASLTTETLGKWHHDLAKAPPRKRTRSGQPQQYRHFDRRDDEAVRRRRSSANRVLTILKAALNRAWRGGLVASDAAWRRVEPFANVDSMRIRYLTVPEAQRLISACDTDFQLLVRAALATGARYGELTRLTVRDFNADSGTVSIQQSKSGKSRHVVLSDEGAALFVRLATGRNGADRMLLKADGSLWGDSHQERRMADACTRGKITPPIAFHGLRHTWASLAVMNGVPLLVIAKNLGHSDTRMVERHYGHLADSYVKDAIRAGAPRFEVIDAGNVVAAGRS